MDYGRNCGSDREKEQLHFLWCVQAAGAGPRRGDAQGEVHRHGAQRRRHRRDRAHERPQGGHCPVEEVYSHIYGNNKCSIIITLFLLYRMSIEIKIHQFYLILFSGQ